MTMMPLVSVVILNYNGAKFLGECIESVLNSTYRNLEVIVVDNASDDNSQEIAGQYKGVILHENYKNLGYAEGNNVGIRFASGKYIVCLNNDIVVDPEWLTHAVCHLENYSGTGIVSCRQMQPDQKEFVDTLYSVPTTYLLFERLGVKARYDQHNPAHATGGYVIGANGASAIYRKKMLQKIGAFDKRFFAYHEESDLCLRAFLQGWRCYYEPNAIVYHKGSASFKTRSTFFNYLHERNRIWFIYKNFPWEEIVRSLPLALMRELRTGARILFLDRQPGTYLKARHDGFVGISQFRTERKANIRRFRNHRPLYRKLLREKKIPL